MLDTLLASKLLSLINLDNASSASSLVPKTWFISTVSEWEFWNILLLLIVNPCLTKSFAYDSAASLEVNTSFTSIFSYSPVPTKYERIVAVILNSVSSPSLVSNSSFFASASAFVKSLNASLIVSTLVSTNLLVSSAFTNKTLVKTKPNVRKIAAIFLLIF